MNWKLENGNWKLARSGLTLTEILVVVGIMAILMAVSIPAARGLIDSFESTASVRQLINAALSNARAIAVRQQTYAGVRFQPDKDGNTYLIFIVHDPDPSPDGTGLANGFRVLEGRKPMKLPEDVGAVSPYWIDRTAFPPSNWNTLVPWLLDNSVLADNPANLVAIGGVSRNRYLLDASTFSIIFSPQGKLTVHPVQVRNKDGKTDLTSNDTIFNVQAKVDSQFGQFYQDDYWNTPNYGIGPEMSVQSFKLYSKKEYTQSDAAARWASYLSTLSDEHISPYTGELVMEYREKNP